jgi:carbamoyltransferase
MGLAPYGRPKYKKIIFENIVDLKSDGSFWLDQSYFNYATGLTMINKKFENLFGSSSRKPEIDNIDQFHMDIAASIQVVIEEIIIKILSSIYKEYKIKNLCLAGGVALNCVVNGKIKKEKIFENIWIQPASGDAGGAIGCSLATWFHELGNIRKINTTDSMRGSFLGPSYEQDIIEKELEDCGAKFKVFDEKKIIELTASELTNDKIIGWFQGSMEFGPRSLGARSIIADPRSKKMQKNLNLKIKFRESFRPFAPSVLREDLSEWFDADYDSPYMLFVEKVKNNKCFKLNKKQKKLFGIDKINTIRSIIPAVTHVDYTSRFQTVHKETNSKFHSLISEFKRLTDCPILVNTSFNVRGEPIVCKPKDAFKCFMGTDIDILVIGNCILYKINQDKNLINTYKDKYKLD